MVVQRAQHDLARVDAGLGEGAAEQLLEHDQPVLRIEEQHREHLVRPRADVQLHVLLHGLGRVEHGALRELLGHGAARELEHRDELGALGGAAHAAHAAQLLGAGLQQAREAAEALVQLLRELQHVLAGHAGAQQQREQLGVGQRGGAARDELLARAGMFGEILESHGEPAKP